MKILLANKFYYPRGGDCTYILNLGELLESHGHETAVFAMQYPENIPSPWSTYFPSEIKFTPGLKMLEAFFRPFGTGEVKRKFTDCWTTSAPTSYTWAISTRSSPPSLRRSRTKRG